MSRFLAQSFAGWSYAPAPGPPRTEDEPPLEADPPPALRGLVAALRHLEEAVLAAGGIVLRYGSLYGPGTAMDATGPQAAALRARRFPVAGRGTGVWSFVHVDDAAAGTLAALERGRPGTYHLVDDEPAPVAEWLPVLAAALGAPPLRRVPARLERLLAGPAAVAMTTRARGAANAWTKRELDWRPAYASWREGFRQLA